MDQELTTIGAAIRRMEEGGYRHLPVVDESERLIIRVTSQDDARDEKHQEDREQRSGSPHIEVEQEAAALG